MALVALLMVGLGAPAASASSRPATTGQTPLYYTTPDQSDIRLVAVSPDGLAAAAATTSGMVDVFNGPFTSSLSPVTSWHFAGNASSLALSNTGPETGGAPLLAMAVGSTLFVYPVGSNTPYFNFSGWSAPGVSPSFYVRDVAISNDGTVVTALVSVNAAGLTGFEFAYFKDGSKLYNKTVLNTQPISLSMDTDGSWAIVGANGATAHVYVYSSTGPSNEWIPTAAQYGPANNLKDAAISGDGDYMYEVGGSGIFVARVSPITPITSNTNATGALQTLQSVATSFNGTQVVGGLADGADYWNMSEPGQSLATPVWSGTYADAVVNVTMAGGAPDYFTVSDGTTLSWYYWYPSVPSGTGTGAAAYYRQVTTLGAIHMVGQSYNEGTTVVGSAYNVGGGQEFALAADEGIQAPSQPSVSVSPVSPNPGDTSASLNISWNTPPAGVTSVTVAVNLTNPSQGGNDPFGTETEPTYRTYVLATGLSFNTNYTITVTFHAYGGARSASSAAEIVKTDSAPPVQDPFLWLEIIAVALLVLGVVVALVTTVMDKKPAENRPRRRKTADQPTEQLPPGFR